MPNKIFDTTKRPPQTLWQRQNSGTTLIQKVLPQPFSQKLTLKPIFAAKK